MLHRFDSIDKEDSDVAFTGLNQVFMQQTINICQNLLLKMYGLFITFYSYALITKLVTSRMLERRDVHPGRRSRGD